MRPWHHVGIALAVLLVLACPGARADAPAPANAPARATAPAPAPAPAIATPPDSGSPHAAAPHDAATPPAADPLADLDVPMVRVPGGPFWMGSNWSDPLNGPRHLVDLPEFLVDVYEVTNEQYVLFVDATGTAPPDHWEGGRFPEEEARLPVVNVSWYDACAFARWAGKRLPTEEEWEKAARGTDGRVFPWGDLYDPDRGNTILSRAFKLMPVGSYPKGASPWGAQDMLGNALEWTGSRFAPYQGSRFIPNRSMQDLRVLRGLSWRYEPRPVFERFPAPGTWKRWHGAVPRPGTRPTPDVIGFRCARDASRDI